MKQISALELLSSKVKVCEL